MNTDQIRTHDQRALLRTRLPQKRPEILGYAGSLFRNASGGPKSGNDSPGPRIGALQCLLDQFPAGTRTMGALAQDLPERPASRLAVEQAQHVPGHVLQAQTLCQL